MDVACTEPVDDNASAGEARPTVLFVDDEKSILNALKRTFRNTGYRLLTAESGAVGLALLARESVDLIVSDMRMPEMDGAEFLAECARRWPNTIRILLTGYADLDSTIEAVNSGRIYRFMAKPWDDTDIKQAVDTALVLLATERDRVRLLEINKQQNAELQRLNAGLEGEVERRTEQLRESYHETFHIFSQLIESRELIAPGHGLRVGKLARRLAEILQIEGKLVQEVYFAGILHDMGKFSLPDALLRKPAVRWTPDEQALVRQHAHNAPRMLSRIPILEGTATIIKHHHERFDGKGYPDGLAGDAIPLGARIVAVANGYDNFRSGTARGFSNTHAQTIELLVDQMSTVFDPCVIAAVSGITADFVSFDKPGVIALSTSYLRSGMILASDLVTSTGMVLYAEGTKLGPTSIDKIADFEQDSKEILEVNIVCNPASTT